MHDATGGNSWAFCASNRLTPCDCRGAYPFPGTYPTCNKAGDAIVSM
jgi:hypothetical protein